MWAIMHRKRDNLHEIQAICSLLLGVALFFFASGCSIVGGTPGLKHAGDFEVTAPDSWKRISRKDSDYAYALESGSIATVVSSCDHRSQAPLDVLSNQLLIGSRKRKIYKRTTEKIGKQTGLWTAAQVEVESVPIQLTLFVTKAGDCVFDFSLMRNGDIGLGDTEQFRKFISSFDYGKD